MTLIALARLMTNNCERLINDHRHTRGGLLANQKNALSAVMTGSRRCSLASQAARPL